MLSYESAAPIDVVNEESREEFSLIVLRAQNDPFAPPSRCCVRVAISESRFPQSCYADGPRGVRCRAFRDFLARRFAEASRRAGADQRREEGGSPRCSSEESSASTPAERMAAPMAVEVGKARRSGADISTTLTCFPRKVSAASRSVSPRIVRFRTGAAWVPRTWKSTFVRVK